LRHKFEDLISINNLLLAWQEFIKGKRNRKDVQEFSFNLMYNIIKLHKELKSKTYKHGGYETFTIQDPKPRSIHKAKVKDRLVHHAVHRVLYPFFDKTFIPGSFSCRINKGTHKAVKRLYFFNYISSKNNTKTAYVLKCDIKKFFDNISHDILIRILKQYIPDKDIIRLLEEVINSFHKKERTGLPLRNLTSQLFVNVYMNNFDQYVKHRLKAEYYIRYADDFIILSYDKSFLLSLIPEIRSF
jgi:retron-type reverse transcriptase